jgi:two-component system catabolic regulation response regulator CreB
MRKILIVDDDQKTRTLLKTYLEKNQYDVGLAHNGETFLAEFNRYADELSLVILDVMLPDTDGFALCKTVRRRSNIPIIMLTASSDETDRVVGLELGADDYIAKPFSPRELVARVRTILRRSVRPPSAAPAAPAPPVPPLALDEDRRQIRYYGQALELSRYEYGILRLLVQKPGRVFTRDELLDKVWDGDSDSFDRTVDAHIKTLRAKLKAIVPEIEPIRTLRGAGYALSEELPPVRP